MTYRKAIAVLLLVVPTATFAGSQTVLSTLQQTPLTAYEAGKSRLESLALIIEIAGSKKKDVPRFDVIEKNGLLGVEVTGTEKASKMSDSYCLKKLQKLNKTFDTNKIPRILWPSLNKEQSSKVMNELFITLTMKAKENSSFSLSCTKTLAQLIK